MPASLLPTTFQVSDEPVTRSSDPVVVVGATVSTDSITVQHPDGFPGLPALLRSLGFAGGRDDVIRVPFPDAAAGSRIVGVVGIPDGAGPDQWRYAVGTAVRQLAGVPAVAVALPSDDPAIVAAALEGAALAAYAFTRYRSSSRASVKEPVARIRVHIPGGSRTAGGFEPQLERAQAIGTAATLVKDLVNTPGSDLYPESFARTAVELAEDHGIAATVWDEAGLAEGGFGGILGVGQGSVRGPRLVKLSYSPADGGRHLALVGKGITFDSGGLSLKPMVGMVGMKYDMTGAATVLAVTLAAATLRLPVRITGWLCLAENLPSGSAVRPNDVLTIRGGRTVEVLNTDAEGRLVLADGLVAASEEQPDAIVDVATLTGAAAIALGNRYAAVMGEEGLVDSVLSAARDSGELAWPMPMPDELRATLNSDVADIANANPGVAAGGMLLAAEFLREFVGQRADDAEGPRGHDGRIPWAHLDIAGPAKGPSAPYGFTGKGATAVMVRTLVRLAEEFSRP